MPQPRLCVFSQTPPVRFLRDGGDATRPLASYREGSDYLVSPGGVTRMVHAFMRHLTSRRSIRGAAWLALSNHGPSSVALASPGTSFHPVRLAPSERERYALSKGALWDAIHGLRTQSPPPREIDEGLSHLSRAMAARAAELHREEPFDLFYVHDFQLLPLARHLPPGVPRAFRWHIPVGELSPALSEQVVEWLNAYDAVVVSSETYAERWRAAGVRVPVHASYPYTGELRQRVVTTEDIARFEARWKLALDECLFLLVARLDPMKSQDDAIRAFASIAQDAPKAKLMLAGGGGFSGGRQGLGMTHAARWRDHLLALAEELGVSERVIFTGTLSENDLELAYTRARAILLPSRVEGFGLAAIEGWLYGHPVLVSQGAGVAELVREGENGYTFAAGDIEALAHGMRKLAVDERLAAAMGHEGRESARVCDPREATRDVWRVLEGALERGPTVGDKEGGRMIRAVLSDLDRTLTGPDLVIDARALARIAELRERGIVVIVVTGRPLPYLVEHGLDRATDGLVAENGAIVCIPRERVLDVRGDLFAQRAQRALGTLASTFHWGRVMGSGPRKAADDASKRLRERGVDHHLAFNAEEVMLLPPGIDKASGARRILDRLRIRPEAAAGIGDGENDVPLLRLCGRSGAPANAAPQASAAAMERLEGAYAEGFLEFTEGLLETRALHVARTLPVHERETTGPDARII